MRITSCFALGEVYAPLKHLWKFASLVSRKNDIESPSRLTNHVAVLQQITIFGF
ncbi:MAG: hypothetical protein LBL74_08315 [Bacteroidales bacterium]|nr:hypothetical protein [Bacteroidales bacterium]